MGKSSIAVKQLLRNKERFADLFNVKVFGGKKVIRPEDLEEIDSESSIIVTDKKKNEKSVQKYRDIVMKWKNDIKLSILACENQNKVHYAMPVRMMLYDSLTYADQIRQVWKNQKDDVKLTEEEFLSKFRKEDKIYTEILKRYVPNYTLNLIDANNVADIQKFQSDLQLIFGMLRYKEETDELYKYMNANREYFANVDLETYQAIRELLHSEKELKRMISIDEREESVDMCKALEDLYNRGVNSGSEAKLVEQIQKKLAKGKSVSQIADELEETVEKIQELIDKNHKPGVD